MTRAKMCTTCGRVGLFPKANGDLPAHKIPEPTNHNPGRQATPWTRLTAADAPWCPGGEKIG